jgi:hypothetical protein
VERRHLKVDSHDVARSTDNLLGALEEIALLVEAGEARDDEPGAREIVDLVSSACLGRIKLIAFITGEGVARQISSILDADHGPPNRQSRPDGRRRT